MSVIDVSLMSVEVAEGTAVLDLAQGWIDNRAQVDGGSRPLAQHLIAQTDEWFGRPFGAGRLRLGATTPRAATVKRWTFVGVFVDLAS